MLTFCSLCNNLMVERHDKDAGLQLVCEFDGNTVVGNPLVYVRTRETGDSVASRVSPYIHDDPTRLRPMNITCKNAHCTHLHEPGAIVAVEVDPIKLQFLYSCLCGQKWLNVSN